MAEAVEQVELRVRIPADVVILGELGDELVDACAELVGEVRGRRPDQGVDVGACGLARSSGED